MFWFAQLVNRWRYYQNCNFLVKILIVSIFQQKMGRQEPQGVTIEGSVHHQALYLNQVTAPTIGSTYFGQYAI